MSKKNKNFSTRSTHSGEVRIIGGQWGSRKILFPNVQGLRPSTDRVRETLFNWLQFDLPNSHCLDVCAGSGVLGFEALSRQAASVDFVEKEAAAVAMIERNANNLLDVSSDAISIHHRHILDFLNDRNFTHTFDIVFVDPPFALNLHAQIFNALLSAQCLSENTLIYCEMPSSESIQLPANWSWYRQKKLKNLSFGLIAV